MLDPVISWDFSLSTLEYTVAYGRCSLEVWPYLALLGTYMCTKASLVPVMTHVRAMYMPSLHDAVHTLTNVSTCKREYLGH